MNPETIPMNEEIEETAIRWFLRSLEPMSENERTEMSEWLRESTHRIAFDEVRETWGELDTLAPQNKPVPLNNTLTLSRRSFFYTAASVMIALGSYGIYRRYVDTPVFSRLFVAPQGQMLQSRLPDGTAITLDTDTQIEVTYYTHRRETRLIRGQVMFSVAHDADKPFTVDAEASRITVVGTRFSVRNIDGDVKVAVQEGHVRVQTGETGDTIDLFPADGIVVTAITRATEKIRVEPKNVGAWQYGRIAFENATIEEAIHEFERYGEKRLRASDDVSHIRITGNFDIKGADSFVKTLPNVAPIQYIQEGEYIVIMPK